MMDSIFRPLLWWIEEKYGVAPKPNDDHLQTGEFSRSLKCKITRRVNKILSEHSSKRYKFGKSGQPHERVKKDDYKNEEPYTIMFKLYESTSEKFVSDFEAYYIKLYKKHQMNDNERDTTKDGMASENGKFYLYLIL